MVQPHSRRAGAGPCTGWTSCILALLLLGLACLANFAAALELQVADDDSGLPLPPSGPDPIPEYTCDDLEKMPINQQCAFVREHCVGDSRIPYTEWYYCSVARAGLPVKVAFALALFLLLPLLFTALGDTAELYFSPTMALIAQTIPGMRPRFAGVTFVAMGNGAPDLSANISALRNGQVALSAGAFTGAAMFVQCIVAGEVIRISGGVKCRGATVRDVGVYVVSVGAVGLVFYSGYVTKWFVVGTALTYVVYASWVFLGDEWHARGRPDLGPGGLLWSDLRAVLLQRQEAHGKARFHHVEDLADSRAPSAVLLEDEAEDQLTRLPSLRAAPWASADVETSSVVPTQPRPNLTQGVPTNSAAHLLDSKMYRQAVWADMALDPAAVLRRRRGVELPVVSASATPDAGTYRPPALSPTMSEDTLALAPMLSHGNSSTLSPGNSIGQTPLQHNLQPRIGGVSPAGSSLQPVSSIEGHLGLGTAHGETQGEGHAMGESEESLPWQRKLWEKLRLELSLGSSQEWGELPAWQRHLREASFCALVPVYAALRLTVPLVDPGTYSQQWLVASLLCSPLAAVVYFNAAGQLWMVAIAIAVGVLQAVVVHVLTRDEEDMPTLDCGTSIAFGPGLISLLGFVMGVMWIDSLASEVVGVVTLLSGLLRLPPSLVGLTLLAWGGSLGDYFGNKAMAKRGASSTALTACFAGPLFNMLMSLSLGFSAHFAKEGISRAPVVLTPDVALGCGAVILYNLILVIVGALNKGQLPSRFYIFSRAWYALYLLVAGCLAVIGY